MPLLFILQSFRCYKIQLFNTFFKKDNNGLHFNFCGGSRLVGLLIRDDKFCNLNNIVPS